MIKYLKDERITDIQINRRGVFPYVHGIAKEVHEDFFDQTGTSSEKWVQGFVKQFGKETAMTVSGVRIRATYINSVQGEKIEVRVLPRKVPTLAGLGLPPIFSDILKMRSGGLVYVVGTTNAGKTSTSAALIDGFNEVLVGQHIVTLEDPVEIIHEEKNALISQINVSTMGDTDGDAYSASLRNVLRDNTKVVMIGETRDQKALEMGISYAESGCLVITTLHTGNVASTIHRIIDMMPPHKRDLIRFQLASQLIAVIAQVLVWTKTGERTLMLEYAFPNLAMQENIRSKDDKVHMIKGEIQTQEARKDPYFRSFKTSAEELIKSGRVTEEMLQGYKKIF